MKIILLKDVKGVGKRFEEKEVSNGYASNFLIPKKLAVALAGTSAGQVKILKEQEEKSKEKKNAELLADIAKVAGNTVSIKVKANEQGHLFSSVNKDKLGKILKEEKGIDLDMDLMELDQPIKNVGEHTLTINLPEGKQTHFTLEILGA